MTGYGRVQKVTENWDLIVEIKSVNSRYLENHVKTSQKYSYLEPQIKKLIKENISRGKVEISLSINSIQLDKEQIKLNTNLLENYLCELRKASKLYSLNDDLELHHLLQVPNLFSPDTEEDAEKEVWQAVKPTLLEGLELFVKSRLDEGKRLQADIFKKLDEISVYVTSLEEQAPKTVTAYRERLTERIKELLQNEPVDENRLLTEVAIFADKVAIDEEIVRLKSHIAQFLGLLEKSEPVGRKCDFLLQEMNREVNTIGSKGNDILVSKIVVELKAILEKIREQIQNIE